MHEQSTDDVRHARRQHDDGHVVLQGPVVEVLEIRIQLDVVTERSDALWKRLLDAVEHVSE